jgi:hypothetical protein
MFLGFFFTLLLLFMFVLSLGGTLIRTLLGLLFGRTPKHTYSTGRGTYTSTEQPRQSAQQSQRATHTTSGSPRRTKIFDKSDGEYVDFEEIS